MDIGPLSILVGGCAVWLISIISALSVKTKLIPWEVGQVALIGCFVVAIVVTGLGARQLMQSGVESASVSELGVVGLGTFFACAFTLFLLTYIVVSLVRPLLNHVSTDIENPPDFVKVLDVRPADANALTNYERVKARQQRRLPHIQPWRGRAARDTAMKVAVDVVCAFGWELIQVDSDLGIVEASEASSWFGFKDDIVIRVRSDQDECVVDMRSASRYGIHDFGVNARRIERYVSEFDSRISRQS